MKEVKEQCEERIEEVVRKRNEALVSRDAAERDDQRQQVIRACSGRGIQEVLPPLLTILSCGLGSLWYSRAQPGARMPTPNLVCWPQAQLCPKSHAPAEEADAVWLEHTDVPVVNSVAKVDLVSGERIGCSHFLPRSRALPFQRTTFCFH